MIVGGHGSDRSKSAWRQAYRGLQHRTARSRCEHKQVIKNFPSDIQDFAGMFVEMQAKRHSADYHPDGVFYKSEVIQDIDEAADVLNRFQKVPVKDRRAFAVYVLLELRN